MKHLALFLLATVGATSLAHAADLSTSKGAPVADKPACFSDFVTYLKASPTDCPLTYAGLTLYGTYDMGYGYESSGVPNGLSNDKVNYGIQKNSRGDRWIWSPNGMSTSVIGIKMKEDLGNNWSLVGVVEAGFNPTSFMLINGPRSLADNNANKLTVQTANFDSSRAGQFDNSQGFAGFSHKDYGTLTFGRTNSLATNATSKYDPTASTAFSQLGFSSSFAGFGATETARVNQAITYDVKIQNFRAAGQVQIGGYQQGNASTAQYQGQLGADFGNFSFDAVGGYAQNAVNLSSYSGAAIPKGYDINHVLKATLSNNAGFELLASYKWDAFKFSGGYIFYKQMNPSDTYVNGLPTIADGIYVPAGAVTSNAYNVPKIVNTFWTGVKWAPVSYFDLAATWYIASYSNYQQPYSSCTGNGVLTSSSKCSGTLFTEALMATYRPVGRVDLYAGLMIQNVTGGNASGFLNTQSVSPTIGARVRF
jgi:predicted porin